MLYRLMAAYTIVFYVLLSMNGGLCRLVKINCVPQRHSFYFEQVQFQSMHRLLSYQRANNADGRTDRQTAFQLYIIDHKIHNYLK